MSTSFDLSSFSLRQAILEIRYPEAYSIWDRAGDIWHSVKKVKPNLKMQDVKPALTSFKLDDNYDLSIKIDRSHVNDLKPVSSLKGFIELTDFFFSLVIEKLEINEISRVGFRLIYHKKYPDRHLAGNSLVDLGLIKCPKGKHFNIEGKVTLPQYILVWEGDSIAVNVKFVVQDTKIDFDPPANAEELSPLHIEKHELILDIDYYTLGSITRGQFNISDWISQAYHLIKRDIKKFVEV